MNISIIPVISAVILGGCLAAVEVNGIAPRPIPGGVTFRTDDNGPAEYWRLRGEVFDKHGMTFGAAMNLLAAESDPTFIQVTKALQARGHDIMDHTPNHSNITMIVERDDDMAWSKSHPGVDHIDGKSVHLRFDFQVPPADRESWRVKVSGHSFTAVTSEGAERWFRHGEYLYFPELKRLCRYLPRQVENGVYPLKSIWFEDNIAIDALIETPVQIVEPHEIQPTKEALEMLAQVVRRVCDRNGISYPVTYCAPGNSPHLTRSTVKSVYGDTFGYKSACVYPFFMARVFNEADPDGNGVFGMQWGDISDEGPSLADLKNDIANQLAHNKVVIIGSHILSNPADWPKYFAKMDDMLAWLKAKQIPVKSHAAWGKILYQSGTQLRGNIFPPMDRDLDEDGNPDGYELVNAKPGAIPVSAGVPERRMLSASLPDDYIFRVQALGGLPHGTANLACWLSGPAGSTVTVTIHGAGEVSFLLKEGWNRYSAPITIPEKQTTARVDFVWKSKVPGTVSVSAIELSEEKPNL